MEATLESEMRTVPSLVTQPGIQRKNPEMRIKIKWPRANMQEVWCRLDEDLSGVLQHSLQGTVERKLNMMGNIIYEECRERFGEHTTKQTTAPRQKGRRERHIKLLISDRRHLRKRWRKAAPDEKEGLKLLWDEIKQKLAKLRRAERIRRRRKRKEKERKNFFKDPFRYARQLLDEKRSGKLAITKEDLEHYIKGQYTDAARDSPLGSPGYVPRPDPPRTPFDTSPPRLGEVREVLKKARSASAPGPNGLPYKVYKNCPQVTKILWKLMQVVWKNQSIPAEWQEAVQLNVEGKLFFSVLARRMTSFLSSNHYIDTSCQKAGLSGFPGCIEHTSVIWEQIQRAKREKSELHVVWLDPANAYGSVPHKLVEFALEFFHIPVCVITIIAKYFNNLRM